MAMLFAPAVRLMNRLSYPRKFGLISFLFVLPLALVMYLLIAEINQQIQFGTKEIRGTQFLRPLHKLLEDIPQSQRLARRFATGTRELRPELLDKATAIDQDLDALDAMNAQHGETLATTERVQTLRSTWQTLRDRIETLQPGDRTQGQQIEQLHTRLFTEVRGLVNSVGDQSNLILDPDLDSYYLMDAVLLKLIQNVELLARIRAVDQQMHQGQALTDKEKADLITLVALAETNLRETGEGLSTAFANNPARNLQSALAGPLHEYENATKELLQSLHTKILEAPTVQISPADYDRRVCQTMAASSQLWDATAEHLEGLLQARIDGLARKKTLVEAFALLMLALVIYLQIGFYLAVRRTIATLADASQRMTAGDLENAVTLENRDELGQVARSFNQIAEQLRTEWVQAREENARATAATVLLRESEEQTRLIIETAQDAVVTLDSHGQITGWNPRAETTFGWSLAEALGRPLAELILAPAQADHFRTTLRQLLNGGNGPREHSQFETRALHRTGQNLPVEVSLGLVRLGEKITFSVFLRDIRERKRAEEALQRAKEAAEAASLAKSEFLANMSHEIRTPMNGILGMTELALDTNLTLEQREYLKMVHTSAHSLLGVINDILDFSKVEAGKLDLETIGFDLRDAVHETLKSLALRAHGKGLELAVNIATDVPDAVVGDPGRFRQILTNLIGNSIKFTEQGEVVVGVQVEERTDTSATLHFSVRDTGIGIPPQKLRTIFNPFEQADSATNRHYGGTGLGLTISARLVELMQGRIWVESEVGKGSTFHFTARFVLGQPSSARPALPVPPSLRGLPVLVVDDNLTNRRILEGMLANWKMQPILAENGRTALGVLRQRPVTHEPIRLLLIDVVMPEMDGFTLVEQIRHEPELAALPIILLTSAGMKGDATRAQQLNVSSYLCKPIKQEDLYAAILKSLHVSSKPARFTTPPVPTLTTERRLPSMRILLAEDNVVNQHVALSLLRRWGQNAVLANNGAEVLAALDTDPFDLVLMDGQMPGMDGFETTRCIRAREQWTGKHLVIVAMTAHAMKGDRERCLAVGMDDYLSKPIKADDLFAVLARYGKQLHPDGESNGVPPAPSGCLETTLPPPLALDRLEQFTRETDRESMQAIVALFLSDSNKRLNSLREAIRTHSANDLREAAHSLKGSSAELGARALSQLCRNLEELGRAQSFDGAEERLLQVEREWSRVQTFLETYVKEQAGEQPASP